MTRTFSEITTEFLDQTALPTVPRIKNAAFHILSFMWILVLIGATVAFVWNSSRLFSRYMSYPVQTRISMRTNASLSFPGVTVCNLNPVAKSEIRCDHMLESLVSLDHIINGTTEQLEAIYKTYGGKLDFRVNVTNQTGTFYTNMTNHGLNYKCEDSTNDYPSSMASCCASSGRKKRSTRTTGNAFNAVKTSKKESPPSSYAAIATNEEDGLYDEFDYDDRFKRDANDTNTTYATYTYNDTYTYGWYQEAPQSVATAFLSCQGTNFNDFQALLCAALPDQSNIKSTISIGQQAIDEKGATFSTFVVDCTYNGLTCMHQQSNDTGGSTSDNSSDSQPLHFKTFYNKRYGNCFTYKADGADYDVYGTTKKWGSDTGLALTLNIHADEYVGLTAPAYGVRVAIQDSAEVPVPEVDGINAGPGMLTEISLRYLQINRLKAPFASNCTDSYDAAYLPNAPNATSLTVTGILTSTTAYSVRTCQKACIDYNLLVRCNCSENLPMQWKRQFERCDFFKLADRKCRDEVYEDISNNILTCDCPPPCVERSYRQKISQTPWPSTPYQHMLINQKLTTSLGSLFAQALNDSDPDYAKKNLVRLQIFYADLTIEGMEEEEDYELFQFISDMGGIMGLYLGLSLVHIFEVVEYLILLCAYPILRRRKQNQLQKAGAKDSSYQNTQHSLSLEGFKGLPASLPSNSSAYDVGGDKTPPVPALPPNNLPGNVTPANMENIGMTRPEKVLENNYKNYY